MALTHYPFMGDRVREHLIYRQRAAHQLTGEQVAFALPGMFGCVLGGLRGGYFGADLIGLRRDAGPRFCRVRPRRHRGRQGTSRDGRG